MGLPMKNTIATAESALADRGGLPFGTVWAVILVMIGTPLRRLGAGESPESNDRATRLD